MLAVVESCWVGWQCLKVSIWIGCDEKFLSSADVISIWIGCDEMFLSSADVISIWISCDEMFLSSADVISLWIGCDEMFLSSVDVLLEDKLKSKSNIRNDDILPQHSMDCRDKCGFKNNNFSVTMTFH